ncbi:AMP-binding protein, partial [Acinetobacter baumannii]
YLACLRAGAAYLPLNPAYTKAEVGYFLGDAEPRVFVCRPESAAALADTAAAAGVPHLLTLGQDDDGTLPDRARDLDADFP